MIGLFLLKLFALCALGTVIDLATEKCLNHIQYSEWYLLPTVRQLELKLMIRLAQRPPHLMSGTTPLNFDTFVNVSEALRICLNWK